MKIIGIILFLLFVVFSVCASMLHAVSLDIRGANRMDGQVNDMSLQDKVGPVSLKANYAYGEHKGEINIDRGSLEVYYDRDVNDKWKIWLFNDSRYDNIYKTRENHMGVGPKYYILKGDHSLSFSTGALYDYNHITGKGHGRYSHRPKYSYLEDYIEATYFYQPAIENNNDYIEKYEVTVVIPYTGKAGKIYCKKEYRSLIGTIEKECGWMVSIEYGKDEHAKEN